MWVLASGLKVWCLVEIALHGRLTYLYSDESRDYPKDVYRAKPALEEVWDGGFKLPL